MDLVFSITSISYGFFLDGVVLCGCVGVGVLSSFLIYKFHLYVVSIRCFDVLSVCLVLVVCGSDRVTKNNCTTVSPRAP
jgi:hypothetical protein